MIIVLFIAEDNAVVENVEEVVEQQTEEPVVEESVVRDSETANRYKQEGNTYLLLLCSL